MTADSNKALVREYFDAFLNHDEAWWDKHIAPGFVRHDPGLDFEVRGPDGIRKLAKALEGLSDSKIDIRDMLADGDKVLARLNRSGRHTGELMGVPASGRTVDIEVMDLFRVEREQLVEHWALMDNFTLLKQIGAIETRWHDER